MRSIKSRTWGALALGAGLALTSGCAHRGQAAEVPQASSAPQATAPASKGEEARRRVEAGALLLDVRTPEEFAQGHLPGALNIPVDALEARLGEVPPEREVVVYCRSGRRSARAADVLRTHGHGQVFDLGAMSDWPASP